MAPPDDLDALSPTELKALVVRLLGKVAGLEQTVTAQREEIARLKGLKGRPALRPSGMEEASEPKPPSPVKGRRGPVTPRVAVEDRILAAAVPPGSRFKGYADFVVQDLVLRACCIRYRRERWLTPDGQLIVAPLPSGGDRHFGPELRRFVLAQYYQRQVTVPRLGGVDGFDDDEAQSKCDEGSEVLVRLLAAERHPLEALQLAHKLLDAGAGAIERLREERRPVLGR